MLAPIVMFVYNRQDHVFETLSALAKNYLAKESDLYVFSDGPRKNDDVDSVAKVRDLIKDEKWKGEFKSIHLVESKENKGLANSIINGVDQIIKSFGKVIVIEDDCVSSKNFLSFMNDCLDYYECNKKIWSIGGYSMNLNIPKDYKHDVYFMGRTCSYAWATWESRWNLVDWNVSSYSRFKWNFKRRREFNKYGMDRSKMLDEQQLGIKNSWAIRFCYAMFQNKMYTVYPIKTKIKNIGYDVGTHVNNNRAVNRAFVVDSVCDDKYVLNSDIEINHCIYKQFVDAFKRPLHVLFAAFLVNNIFKIKKR